MSEKPTASPSRVLEVMRSVLMEHMDTDQYGPWYRPQTIVALDAHTGRTITEDDVLDGMDVEGALLITMRDGNEYKLTLEVAPGLQLAEEQESGQGNS